MSAITEKMAMGQNGPSQCLIFVIVFPDKACFLMPIRGQLFLYCRDMTMGAGKGCGAGRDWTLLITLIF
ncbi:hypothetical protein ACF2JD_19550 [Aeromonas sp. A-5]|uniref:hypothetical protein n=1 Tax=Aeromonas ichthyocola TaxID=3367746 RepID=UPI0038F1ADE8